MNNMNFEEFVLQIQNLLRESDSNLDIQVQTVSKNNGIHYTGLTCRNINTAVSPVIYMEALREKLIGVMYENEQLKAENSKLRETH